MKKINKIYEQTIRLMRTKKKKKPPEDFFASFFEISWPFSFLRGPRTTLQYSQTSQQCGLVQKEEVREPFFLEELLRFSFIESLIRMLGRSTRGAPAWELKIEESCM